MLSPGVALGHRYELEERVGVGGYCEVWRARDLTLGRPVAVKVLHPGYVQNAEALARFEAEARHAGSLSHQNIARVYDYGEPYPPYLVMELVEGPSIAQLLDRGPIDPVRTMDVIAQAAEGLQAAHGAGLIHRDIKPGNLLLTPDGTVKITDFGISHAVDSPGVTSTGQVVGTAGYLAPERANGAGATELSDLYSLGVVAYECLAGEPPFDGTAIEVALAHTIRPLPALPACVPADVGALVAVLTAKDPADRPGSAAAVARRARQLGDRLASTASLGAAPAALEPRSRRPRRSAIAAAAAAAAIVLIALVVLVVRNAADSEHAGHPAVAPPSTAARPVPGGTRATKAAVTIDVNGEMLVGQPVGMVVSQLRQQGLVPRVIWQSSDQQRPGRVTDVWPTGQRPPGTLVTVVGALRDSATAAPSPSAGPPTPSAGPPTPPAGPPSPPAGPPNGNGDGNGKHRGSGNGNGDG